MRTGLRLRLFALALVAGLMLAAVAQARQFTVKSLSDNRVGSSTEELRAQARFSRSVIRFFTVGWGEWMTHSYFRSCGQILGAGRYRACLISREALKNHRYLLGVASRKLSGATTTGTPGAFPGWWLRAALCVHAGEGSWQANTGNGFSGGLQFLDSTWLSNGGGRFAPRAYLATPHEQLLVAYWLWQRSGWGPWPNTARACGLL